MVIFVLDNKGQALIEFILILPVFLLLLFVIVDFGVIFNAKSNLENVSSDIISLYKDNNSIDSVRSIYKDYDISLNSYDEYDKLVIEKDVNLITPGMNRILSDPYVIRVERVISNVK